MIDYIFLQIGAVEIVGSQAKVTGLGMILNATARSRIEATEMFF
jgi:hypothetical protein